MTRMDEDISDWQRQGPLFGCYDEPQRPGDRLCVETGNVYHHERMVQVGPYSVHKDIHDSYFYPPKPEDYDPPKSPEFGPGKVVALILGLLCLGVGLGLLFSS